MVGQISSRHFLKGDPHGLDYHHPVEQSLFDALNTSSSGVFVHWGVYGSGKSTAVRNAAWRLQQEVGRQVISLQSFDFRYNEPSRQKDLRRLIGVPEDMHEPLSELLTKPAGTTLVIDHAELLMRDKDNRGDEMLEMVLELIKESEATKKFNVLLVVTTWERAKELVDVGCKLVPGDAPGRWTREQLEALFATASEPVREKVGEKKDELLRLATLSGTPGFLTFEAHNEKYDSRHAIMHDLEWRKGVKALYNPLLELPDWWSGLPRILMEEGRFPDKNGVYHHADLASLPADVGNACQGVQDQET